MTRRDIAAGTRVMTGAGALATAGADPPEAAAPSALNVTTHALEINR